MSNDNNIQSLKRDFYRNHFGELLLFLDNPNLNPRESQLTLMASVIGSINQSCNYELYDYGRAPFLKLQVNPQVAVAAVEEFFDIMGNDNEAMTRVGRILKYLRDPAGNGTQAEMHDLKDDMIVRTICNYFWEKVNRKPLVAISYQRDHGATTYEYDDFQPKNKNNNKYNDLIMGPVMALLGENYRIFTLFLHVVRNIRNKASHTDKFSDLAVGYQLYRFILFVYVTTVLLIRKAQYPKDPYAIPQIRMFIDGSYDCIKLTANGKVLPLLNTDDGRHYYQVQWYQEYILEIDDKKKSDIRWNCNDLEPRAAKDNQGIKTYSNDAQVDNDAHSVSFHQAMDAFEKALVELRAIEGNTESIPQIYGLLVEGIEQQEHQNASLEKIAENLDRFSESLQKDKEERDKVLIELFGAQNKLIEKVINWLDSNQGLPEKITKTARNTQIIKWLLILIAIILLVGGAIWAIWYFLSQQPSLTASEWVKKGDQCFLSLTPKDDSNVVKMTFEQARSASDRAGEAYRQAIKLYKDSLEQDSNNTSANIALATLLMQGKGEFDLPAAIKCAKRAKTDRRGLGLYAYLLFLNGEYEAAHYVTGNYNINEHSDPYLRLTKILLTLYGDDETLKKQSRASIYKLIEEMEEISESSPEIEAECRFCYADRLLDGIYFRYHRDGKNVNKYLLDPDPLYACELMMSMVHPRSFAEVSSVLLRTGNIYQSLLYSIYAYGCGLRQVSPNLAWLLHNYEEPSEDINDYLDSISRNDRGDLDTKLLHFLHRVNQDRGTEDDYREAWALLELIKKDHSNQAFCDVAALNEEIVKLGIILALRYGDVGKASEWIASNEDFPDTSAVKDYILFSSYYLNKDYFPIDSVSREQSDSLLRSAYMKGYPKAIRSLIIRQIMNAFCDKTIDITTLPDSVWKQDQEIATALACYWMIRGEITGNFDDYLMYDAYATNDFKGFVQLNWFEAHNEPSSDKYVTLCDLADVGIAYAIRADNPSLVQWYCRHVTDIGSALDSIVSRERDFYSAQYYKKLYHYYQWFLIDDSTKDYHYPIYLLSSPFDELYRMVPSEQKEFVNLFYIKEVPISISVG